MKQEGQQTSIIARHLKTAAHTGRTYNRTPEFVFMLMKVAFTCTLLSVSIYTLCLHPVAFTPVKHP